MIPKFVFAFLKLLGFTEFISLIARRLFVFFNVSVFKSSITNAMDGETSTTKECYPNVIYSFKSHVIIIFILLHEGYLMYFVTDSVICIYQ